jgi:hypothetical protein
METFYLSFGYHAGGKIMSGDTPFFIGIFVIAIIPTMVFLMISFGSRHQDNEDDF